MIYINDKFIEMYAEMTKKFYDSINEENKKQKDMIEFINYLKELIERNHSLEKEKQELIEYLKERETELKENVRTYEEKLRQTPRESFYYNSYLKTLHRYRAKRELIKEILNKIEKR